MVAMNDLIVCRRDRWFMGVLRSPMTRRLTLSHLLVVLLPAAVAFWLLQLYLDNRDVKRAQLTAEALLLAQVVEGRLPNRTPVDFVQADGVNLEGFFETITLPYGVEVIAFGPQGEQRTLTPGHSLEAQSAFTSLGAWPVWLGPQSPVVLDHLAEIHRQICLQTTTSVNRIDGVGSVIAAVIDARALPRAPQSQSVREQIWASISILHRQEMVGGLALRYPVKARDPLAALRLTAAMRGLGLTQLTPKVLVIIEGLPTAFGDILSAFLSNAIQRGAWGDDIRIWTRIQERMVVVVVEDTGPPFLEGVNQSLFGAGDPAALGEQDVEGFTAGLAEAAQIVAAHSDVIRAEPVQPSGAGQAFGARFLFGLPV